MSKTILSNSPDARKEYSSVVDKTKDAILSSFDDSLAFSGIDPESLRREINSISLLPDVGLGFDGTLELLKEKVFKHLLRTWSKSYMPHLHSPALFESLSAEMVISAFNDSLDSWDQGPSATEVEVMVIKNLLELYGFDKDQGDGAFTSGGSQSNLTAIISARDKYINKYLGWDVKKHGLPSIFKSFRMYTSEISHFSMDKASHIIGLGYDAVVHLPVNDEMKIDTKRFEEILEEDVKKGFIPFLAVATLGTTDFGSIDDVKEMRRICDRFNMALHLDAAYGSALILSENERYRLGDVSLADSITIDFHKMFLLNISSSCVLFKDKSDLEPFNLHADYLNREEDEEEGYINLVGKGIQTTRRFDALKVLFAFLSKGKKEYAAIIERLLDNAEYAYKTLLDEGFIAPVRPELSSVVFCIDKDDDVNKRIRRTLLSEGTVIGQTVLSGRVMLKLTLLNPDLKHSDLDQLIKHIKELS